jgi:hypothetical protein
MGRFIIKIEDLYFEWSTIVDAPVTYGMTLEQLEDHIRYRYGQEGIDELPKRLERVEKQGTSINANYTVDEIIKGNRAGDNEKCLTKKQIYKKYCKDLSDD